jgi:flagellar hook protein FlgE
MLIRWILNTVLVGAFLSQGLSWAQMVETGNVTDLAINGKGWFILREPLTGEIFVTRCSAFLVNSSGYLVFCNGLRLQGYNDPACSTQGDMMVNNPDASPDANIREIRFTSDGKLVIGLTDGTRMVRGQILLQNFRSPDLLTREAYKLYALSPEVGPLDQPRPPSSGGLGELLSGWFDATPEPVRLSLLRSASQTGFLTQGLLTDTSIPTDLAIKRAGFFIVRDPKTSTLFATRAGMFLVDAEGYLITYDRFRVQGYSDYGLCTPGDVRIDSTGAPTTSDNAVVTSFAFDLDGKVTVRLSDGTSFVRGQILLSTFAHPELMTPTNHGLYTGVAQAQRLPSADGQIRQGALELINVPEDLLDQRRTLSLFPYGSILFDTNVTHLVINGTGFFALRNPSDHTQYVTRRGAFELDNNGYLVNAEGLRLQGYSDPELTTIGDMHIDLAAFPEGKASCSFDLFGRLTVRLDDGTTFVRGQILLQSFRESFLLRSNGSGLYTNLDAAVPLPQPAVPGYGGLGRIIDRAMEEPASTEKLTLPSRNGIRLIITGEPGRHWTIEAANHPGEWTSIMEIDDSPEELELTDTDSINFHQRFYRVTVGDPTNRTGRMLKLPASGSRPDESNAANLITNPGLF